MLLLRHQLRRFRQNLHFNAYLKKKHPLFAYLIISLHFVCNAAENLEEETQEFIALSATEPNQREGEINQDKGRASLIEESESTKTKDLLSEVLQSLDETEANENISQHPQDLEREEQQTSLLCGLDGFSRFFDSESADPLINKAQAEISKQPETSEDLFTEVITETKRLSKKNHSFPDDKLQKSLTPLLYDLENCRSPFLVCQEIIKFNRYSIQKMKPYEPHSKWNGILTAHEKLTKKAQKIIQHEVISMSDRLREINEKLDVEDECRISIKFREQERISLKIAVPKKSLAIYFFIEKGTVPYTVKVREWLNFRRYLPWSIESNIGVLNFNIISLQDQEEDNDGYCKSWDVEASYLSFALDKLAEDINRFCKKPLECMDSISGYPDYTNDRYYFSQVLNDYFQIQPISSIAELRDNCSSNAEVARYFFSRAEHLPGYRSGIL
jgi:hypothetical protein